MKIINRQNFVGTASTVFTILVLGKILLEFLMSGVYGNYQGNLLFMFVLSFAATFVLSQHYRFAKYPLSAVILGQYILLIGAVMLFTWWSGHFQPLHEEGYRDMFLSFSIPYLIGVAIYYASVFHEIKCANEALKKIREAKEGKCEERDREGE